MNAVNSSQHDQRYTDPAREEAAITTALKDGKLTTAMKPLKADDFADKHRAAS